MRPLWPRSFVPPLRFVFLPLAAAAAIGTAVWMVHDDRSRRRVRLDRSTRAVAPAPREEDPAKVEARAEALRIDLEPRLLEELSAVSSLRDAAAERLKSDVLEALSVYLTGDSEAHLERLRTLGRPVPVSMAGMDNDALAKYLRTQTSSLRDSRFEPAGIRARALYIRGRRVVDEAEPMSVTYLEPDGKPLDPAGKGLDVYEVSIPAEMPDMEGKLWACRFALWMVRAEGAPGWRVWKVALYDVPGSARVLLPPPE